MMLMIMLEKRMMVMKIVTKHISTRQNPMVTPLITTDKNPLWWECIWWEYMLLSHAMLVIMTITKQAATVTP